jgi:hypothetical protein
MIFPWIWKLLPGNKAAKILQLVLILAAGSALLLLVVFPWLDAQLVAPPVVGETRLSPNPQAISKVMGT